jgi:hypothetical protein
VRERAREEADREAEAERQRQLAARAAMYEQAKLLAAAGRGAARGRVESERVFSKTLASLPAGEVLVSGRPPVPRVVRASTARGLLGRGHAVGGATERGGEGGLAGMFGLKQERLRLDADAASRCMRYADGEVKHTQLRVSAV